MNIVVKQNDEVYYEIGDIYEIENSLYILLREDRGYILRGLTQSGILVGFNGFYNRLPDLIKDLEEQDITPIHYSKEHYHLVLTKK